MPRIAVIGSDSFIANKFIGLLNSSDILLFSRILTGKKNEIILNDLFEINSESFTSCDVVINFTAIVHNPSENDESLYKHVNTDLPLHLAQEAKKANVKQFIQMSSIAVYGTCEIIKDLTPTNPVSIYGKTKLEADEKLLTMVSPSFKVAIVRPPMVYGGGLAPGNMLKLIRHVDRKLPLPFKGVRNERTFIHVKNLADFLTFAIYNNLEGIYIPCDTDDISTEELVKLIGKHLQKNTRMFKLPKLAIKCIKLLKPDLYHKLFDSMVVERNNSISAKGYKPKYTISEGIADMAKALKDDKQ